MLLVLIGVGVLVGAALALIGEGGRRGLLFLAISAPLTVVLMLLGYRHRLTSWPEFAGLAMTAAFPFFTIGFLLRVGVLPRRGIWRAFFVILSFGLSAAVAILTAVNAGLVPLF